MRFSNRELDPLWGAGLRFSLAAFLLIAAMLVMRLALPRGRVLAGAVAYGLLNFAVSFSLAYYALSHVQAGLGQTVFGLVPLATLLLAILQRQERLRVAAAVGAVLAVAGVAVMARAPLSASVSPLVLLALLGSVLAFAQAGILVRRLPPVHPIAFNAVGMATGSAVLLVGSLIARETQALPTLATTWLALAYLVPVGSVLVFVLSVVVLKYWPASRAAYAFVLIPVVTIVLSAWLDDEPITSSLVIGGVLVLGGVYVGALRTRNEVPVGPPGLEPGTNAL